MIRPTTIPGAWRCPCDAYNSGAQNRCPRCGCPRDRGAVAPGRATGGEACPDKGQASNAAPGHALAQFQPVQTERELQRWAERYLESMGYLRPDQKRVDAGRPRECRGVYYHLPQARGNPFALDLIVLDRTGRWLALELKSATGRVSARQEWLCWAAGGSICRSAGDVQCAVQAWRKAVDGVTRGEVQT
jgi:hypothetical protein